MRLKKLFFVLILFSFTTLSFSQSVSEVSQISEDSIILEDTQVENNINLNNSGKSSGSSILFFIRMIVILALVCAAIYGIMKLFGNSLNKTKNNDEFLRRVSYINLGPGKSVEIVTLLDHAYLLGVTDSNINLLGEVSDKELISAMNLFADKNQNIKKPKTFNEVLALFMPNAKASGNASIFENETQNVEDILKKKREKLNTEE